MADYSSDEESILENTSEVFLGFVDVPIEKDDPPTIEDTFIGGEPIWLHPESTPAEAMVTCDNCGKKMALLLQAFAPVEGQLYDRVLYLFGCKNTAVCTKKKGSIKCIRGILKDPKKMNQLKQEQEEAARKQLDEKLRLEDKKKMKIELTKDLFSSGKSDNPFGNPFGASENPFAVDKKKDPEPSSKQDPKEVLDTSAGAQSGSKPVSYAEAVGPAELRSGPRKLDEQLPTYPGYFVYVDQERFKKVTLEPELEKYKDIIEQAERESGESSGGRRNSASLEPPTDPDSAPVTNRLNDKYFEAFTNTVSHNPGQVLRYSLGGRPLLYCGLDEIAPKFSSTISVPNPGYNPSSTRRFELQLMPKAIYDLETVGQDTVADILNGMSWGTIIVCTDEEDYMPEFDGNHVGYVEEWVGVQWE
jgi:pre-rRNA-processing protein TSR4